MKLLIVGKLYYPWIGGVETVMQQIAEKMSDPIVPTVLCCQPKGKTKKEVVHGVSVIHASSFGMLLRMPVSISFFWYFYQYAKSTDVINIHHPFPLASLAYLLFGRKKKLVVHYHSSIVRQKIAGFFVKPVTRIMLKKAQTIIVSSPELKMNTTELQSFQDKVTVIGFGVDQTEIQKNIDENAVQALQKKYGKFVLFVGRLNYYKGVNVLIQAMKDVSAICVIIGEGVEKPKLVALAHKLGIENRIIFLPHQAAKNLYNYYKAATVFVLPSIYKTETFGLVLLHAMAVGTPVISTDLGTGTTYINKHGESGLVVPPNDHMALTKAIQHMLTDGEMAKKLGLGARKRVSDVFSESKMIVELSNIFRS